MAVLLHETLAHGPGFGEILGRVPDRPIHRDGPEIVGEVRALGHINKKARKDDVQIESPVFVAQRVHPGRQGVHVKILADQKGAVPEGQGRHRRRLNVRIAKGRGAAMTGMQPKVQGVGVGVGLAGKGVGDGPAVQKADVVDFLEGVFDQLPVGLDLGGPRGAGGRNLAKRITVQAAAQFAQIFGQGFLRLRIDVDENKSLPHLAGDRRQAQLGLLQSEEVLLVGHEFERAVQGIRPAVELAGEQLA